jgi:hypothetical protein
MPYEYAGDPFRKLDVENGKGLSDKRAGRQAGAAGTKIQALK